MSRILVVDDDPPSREFLVTLLGYTGHEVLEAATGAEALDVIRNRGADLVISDVLMPVMDGYMLARELKADPRFAPTPVIFWTSAYQEAEARRLALACGVDAVLTKPVAAETVLSAVSTALTDSSGQHPRPAIPDDFDREHGRLLTDKLALKVRELDHTNALLRSLLVHTRELAAVRDGQVVMRRFLATCRLVLTAAATVVLRQQGQVQLMTEDGAPGTIDPAGYPRLMDLLERVQQPAAIRDVVAPEFAAELGVLPGSALLAIGLRSAGATFGATCLTRTNSQPFTESDEQVLEALAAHCAVCYEHAADSEALVREIVERCSVERQLRDANDQIRSFNQNLEARIRERSSQLRDMVQQLEAFTYMVSHDLRSPLFLIGGFSELLLTRHSSQIPPEAKDLLERIGRNIARMHQLIQHLLDFCRSSRRKPSRERFDMSELVRSVIADFPQDGRRIEISVEELPPAYADPILLRQVLVNLLANALKFAHARDVIIIRVSSAVCGAENVYSVSDNGIGFSPEEASKLFLPFQRLAGAAAVEGYGIGLATVRQIIEQHGGRVWAHGTPGEGSQFFFSLPNTAVDPPDDTNLQELAGAVGRESTEASQSAEQFVSAGSEPVR